VSRLFDTQVRFTGISLSYGIAAGVIGGLTPLLASSLFLWAKSSWPIALNLVGVGVISMIAVIVSPSFGSEASLQETPLAGGALSRQAPGN
jgi:MFS transporter, MHS family, shikimate and dehydroshikimate transport protein